VLLSTLIERKRDGHALAPGELRTLLDAYMRGDLRDYQMSAFLMAVFFRGLDADELTELTRAMIRSGTRLDFDDGGPPAVDKHSTGGVGDKVSLVLAPLVAEMGLRVPMMSGRGLGHTGGTLDKLEAIPGFDVRLDLDRFRTILDDIGCAMIGQTPEIAPLDGRLYALRDVTGTVPALPLIASSIVSKKVAEGISALVLDVKFGRGAFMKDLEDARILARTMVRLAASEGVRATALLTAMDAPLGRAVGNGLEVVEAIECLRGGGPPDLREVTVALAAELLVGSGVAPDGPAAARALEDALDSGAALQRFARLVELQGGDPRIVDDPDLLRAAPARGTVEAASEGWILELDARAVGLASVELGAGRRRVDDAVDPSVGFELHVGLGDPVLATQPLVTIHARDGASAAVARTALERAIRIGPEAPERHPVVLERIA
jgi:pyrimidine-nucleoside phosphorylase